MPSPAETPASHETNDVDIREMSAKFVDLVNEMAGEDANAEAYYHYTGRPTLLASPIITFSKVRDESDFFSVDIDPISDDGRNITVTYGYEGVDPEDEDAQPSSVGLRVDYTDVEKLTGDERTDVISLAGNTIEDLRTLIVTSYQKQEV